MKAVFRLGLAIAAAGLWLGQAPALAQSAPPPTSNTPATEAIGPAQLQNFNLQGTVTKPADAAPTRRTTQVPKAPATVEASQSDPATEPRPARRIAGTPQPQKESPAPVAIATPQPPVPLPVTPSASAPAAAPASLPLTTEAPSANLAPEHSLAIWPWLLAALALGVGGGFLFWRRNNREAYAGGPHVDEFVAPQPQPRAPAPPAPAPVPPPPAAPAGIVSTRMRPSIEVAFQPMRCIVEEQRVTLEFELEVLNSGNGPARNVLIEGSLFNAGATQDEEIGAFFASPAGQGERIPVIPPMQRVELRPQLHVALDQLRILDAGGRRFFVPLIAFNAFYERNGGAGQTSVAWLIGRDTKAEKLAPFRVDLGPRVFRGLAARPLPISVRR